MGLNFAHRQGIETENNTRRSGVDQHKGLCNAFVGVLAGCGLQVAVEIVLTAIKLATVVLAVELLDVDHWSVEVL